MESRRLGPSEQPYFTPGFPLALPLEHAVRIRSLDGPATAAFPALEDSAAIRSDTGELNWYRSPADNGLVTVDTDRTQALIGFVKANRKTLRNFSAEVDNDFASLVLSSLDGKPLARSERMLLSTGTRVTNSNMKWNDTHTRVLSQGESPTLIEPVTGTVTLRNLQGATAVTAVALDGARKPVGDTIAGKRVADGWSLPVGEPATVWYLVSIHR
jgi:hypothetical protein